MSSSVLAALCAKAQKYTNAAAPPTRSSPCSGLSGARPGTADATLRGTARSNSETGVWSGMKVEAQEPGYVSRR